MVAGYGGNLQGATLTQWGTDITGGKAFEGVTVVECVEDGDIEVTWKDGSTQTITRTAAWVNPIECKSVRVVSGTWVLAKV